MDLAKGCNLSLLEMCQLPMNLPMKNKEKSVGINFTDRLIEVKHPSVNDTSIIKK